VADGGDWLSGFEEAAHEAHGALVHSQPIGVHHAAGKHECVELIGARAVEREIDRDLIAPMIVLPGLDRSTLWGDEGGFRA
jgi:hypothetical protein